MSFYLYSFLAFIYLGSSELVFNDKAVDDIKVEMDYHIYHMQTEFYEDLKWVRENKSSNSKLANLIDRTLVGLTKHRVELQQFRPKTEAGFALLKKLKENLIEIHAGYKVKNKKWLSSLKHYLKELTTFVANEKEKENAEKVESSSTEMNVEKSL